MVDLLESGAKNNGLVTSLGYFMPGPTPINILVVNVNKTMNMAGRKDFRSLTLVFYMTYLPEMLPRYY